MRPRAWFVLFSLLLPAFVSQATNAAGAQLVPAGTILTVRTTQPIFAEATRPGALYTGIVENPVVGAGGRVVIPPGATATLEVVGMSESSNLKGRDRLMLMVRSVRMGGRAYPVSTNYVQLRGPSEGKRARNKALGGAGIGAVVGGLIGGGAGAAIGATAGAGTGLAVAGSGKTHLVIPAETLLQFQFTGSPRIE